MEQTQPISPRVGANTDRGKVRTENQDRIDRFESPFGQVFIVADGMGGHEGGATAAKMLADGLQQHLRGLPPSLTPAEALQTAATRANAEIYQRANSGDPKTAQMGATSVLALLRGNQVVIAHAGDSRAYLLRGGVLSRLTHDHTVVQRMLDHNMLSPEEARDHPDASVVTRAFGQKPDVELEISPPVELQPGDRLLLCSDGLCGYVEDEPIRQVLARSGEAQAIADALIALALEAGGEDNVSVQVLVAEGAGGRRPTVAPPLAPAPRRGPSWIAILFLVLAALLLGVLLSRFWDQWKGRQAEVGETPSGTEISLDLSKDKKVIRSLLSHLRGLAYRGAGNGFKAGRIYFRDNDDANGKADEIRDRLRSARPGKPSYETEPWPDNLPPEIEEKMQGADIVIVWYEGKPERSDARPQTPAPSPANAPEGLHPGDDDTPLDQDETPAAKGEPSEAPTTPGRTSIYLGPANPGQDGEVLRYLLSGLTGVAIRPASSGFQEGRVYYRQGFDVMADYVVNKMNQKAPPGSPQYQKEPGPSRLAGEPGINVVVIPLKGREN